MISKLWKNPAFETIKGTISENIKDTPVSISVFGMFLYVEMIKDGIHISASVRDYQTLVSSMIDMSCHNLRTFMEETIQACFGYDVLLIEQRFLVTFGTQEEPYVCQFFPSNPKDKDYVYHWVYANTLGD